MFARRQAVKPDRGTEAGGAKVTLGIGTLGNSFRLLGLPNEMGCLLKYVCRIRETPKPFSADSPVRCQTVVAAHCRFFSRSHDGLTPDVGSDRGSLNCNRKKEFDLRKQAPAQQTNRQTGFSFFFLSTCRRNGLTFSSPAADFSVLVCTTAVSGAVRFELFARAAPFFKPSDLRGCLFARGQVRTGSPPFSYCG